MLFKYLFIFLTLKFVLTFPSSVFKRNANHLCVVNTDKHIYNLTKLHRNGGYKIQYNNLLFLLNVCGDVPNCNADEVTGVSVCRIDNKSKNISILGLENHFTVGGSDKFDLVLRYNYHYKKKYVTEINFKCNRHIEANVTFVPANGDMGKRHKFIFETDAVCVKQPLNCLVKFKFEDYEYNLYPLYMKNKDYKIESEGSTIILNVCGDLNTKLGGDCSYNGTQICMLNKNGEYKNLGIFPKINYQQKPNVPISFIFTEGSRCSESAYIETQIDFVCCLENKKPILLYSTACKYIILWETKYACPHYNFIYHGCQTNTNEFFDERDFNQLPESNRTTHVEDDYILQFSICKSLQNCSGFNNVSVCVIKNQQQFVYGWHNQTILSEDMMFQMVLYGEKCTNDSSYITHIKYVCAYSREFQGKINIEYQPCSITILFHTNFACPIMDIKPTNIILENGNVYSNISHLSLLDKNYEYFDEQNNTMFSLNIGLPVLFNNVSMCLRNTAVCMCNMSEPDITKRFIPLGLYPDNSNIKIHTLDKELVLEFDNGGTCSKTGTIQSYTSLLHFICDRSTKSENIVLRSKTICNYIFEFRTPVVCSQNIFSEELEKPSNEIKNELQSPIIKNDERNEAKKDNFVIEGKQLKEVVEVKDEDYSSLKLNTTENRQDDGFPRKGKKISLVKQLNGTMNDKSLVIKDELLKKISERKDHNPFLDEIDQKKEAFVKKNEQAKKVTETEDHDYSLKMQQKNINIKETDISLSKQSNEDNHKDFNDDLSNKKGDSPLSEEENEEFLHRHELLKQTNRLKDHKLSKIFITNCSLIDLLNKNKINMTKLPQKINIESNIGRKYLLDICSRGKCHSPICGGPDLSIPYGSNLVQHYNIDKTQALIQLSFTGQQKCNDMLYDSIVDLKCSNVEKLPTVLKEEECSVHFEWYNTLTCNLLGITEVKKSNTKVIISIFIIVFVVFIAVAILIVFWRKHQNYQLLNKSDLTIYYKKNAND